MKFRSATAGAAMVIGAMTIALGTAHADPAPAPTKPELIDYSIQMVNKAVVTTLKGGTFQLVDKPGATPADKHQQIVNVKDKAGRIAMEMPVDYRVSGVQIPVQPVVKDNGKVLELTPQKPAGLNISKQTLTAQPVASTVLPAPAATDKKKIIAQPIASPAEDSAAMNDFATKFGLATGVGSFIGLAVGAVVGCIFGLPLFGVGCLAGIPVGATLGGVIGTIAFGGPTLAAAGYDLVNTLQAKPGTTKFAQNTTPAPAATPAPAPSHKH